MAGGDKCREASGRDLSGRNVSEGIEPRNRLVIEVDTVLRSGKLHEGQRNGELLLALSGSEAVA